jgi:hypothetical protein
MIAMRVDAVGTRYATPDALVGSAARQANFAARNMHRGAVSLLASRRPPARHGASTASWNPGGFGRGKRSAGPSRP